MDSAAQLGFGTLLLFLGSAHFFSGICSLLLLFCGDALLMVSGANALKGHIWNHGGSTFGPGSGPVCSGSWLADWQAGWPELLAACLTGWLAGCLGSPGHLGFETIFCLCSRMGSIFVSGLCSLLGDMEAGATELGSTPDTLRVCFGGRIWAWLLRVVAGWLIGWPARPARDAAWMTGWLAG